MCICVHVRVCVCLCQRVQRQRARLQGRLSLLSLSLSSSLSPPFFSALLLSPRGATALHRTFARGGSARARWSPQSARRPPPWVVALCALGPKCGAAAAVSPSAARPPSAVVSLARLQLRPCLPREPVGRTADGKGRAHLTFSLTIPRSTALLTTLVPPPAWITHAHVPAAQPLSPSVCTPLRCRLYALQAAPCLSSPWRALCLQQQPNPQSQWR